MKNKKIYLIIAIVIIIILVVLSLFNTKKVSEEKITIPDENEQVDNSKISSTPTISTENDKKGSVKISQLDTNHNIYPLNINWQNNVDYHETVIDVYNVRGIELNLDFVNRMVKYFKLDNKAIVDDEEILAFSDNNDLNLVIDKKNLSIAYTKDLLIGNVKLGPEKADTENLKFKTIKMVKNLVNLPAGVEITINNVKQESEILFDGSEDFNANIIQIEAIYTFKNLPLYTASNVPIIAKYLEDGTLIKFIFYPPFASSKVVDKYPLKSFSSVKEIPVSSLNMFSVKGGEEVYGEEIVLDNVDIIKSYLGYLYFNNNEYLQPYIFFEGKSNFNGDTVEVLMGMPALKEEYYR